MDSLEIELDKASYSVLFLTTGNNKLEDLWKTNTKETFIRLIQNMDASANARFLASEILFLKSQEFPLPGMHSVLGSIYANAIKSSGVSNEDNLLPANGWGFLYEMDDVGPIGKKIILIGEPVIEYLVELLDNEDDVLYIGSQDATIGNSYIYRVKDIAAFYIAKIRGIPIRYHKKMGLRNKEIEQLRNKIY